MEADLTGLMDRALSPVEAASYSPLALAFLGDAAFEIVIRLMLVESGHARPDALNRRKAALVRASSQSAMMEKIEPLLSEEEHAVYRRGRNARTSTVAKHARISDYRRATGFEALMGYLQLCGRKERMLELIGKGLEGNGPD